MSKDSNEERDDEIIVSFAKTPPAVAAMSGAGNATDGNAIGTGQGSGRVPWAKEVADELVARISSERVVAAAEPMRQRASSGEEQSHSSSSVAPKSVLVLIGGTQELHSMSTS